LEVFVASERLANVCPVPLGPGNGAGFGKYGISTVLILENIDLCCLRCGRDVE
jgi:hypothetical protein